MAKTRPLVETTRWYRITVWVWDIVPSRRAESQAFSRAPGSDEPGYDCSALLAAELATADSNDARFLDETSRSSWVGLALELGTRPSISMSSGRVDRATRRQAHIRQREAKVERARGDL
jgi:hypothetical protein